MVFFKNCFLIPYCNCNPNKYPKGDFSVPFFSLNMSAQPKKYGSHKTKCPYSRTSKGRRTPLMVLRTIYFYGPTYLVKKG